jgi:hypothetical protein
MKGIQTGEQQADIFTNPLAVSLFQYLRNLFMGW